MASCERGFLTSSKIYTGVAGLIAVHTVLNMYYSSPPGPLDSTGFNSALNLAALSTALEEGSNTDISCDAASSKDGYMKVLSYVALSEQLLDGMQAHISDIANVLSSDHTQMRQSIAIMSSLEDSISQSLEGTSSSVKLLTCIQDSLLRDSPNWLDESGDSKLLEELQEKIRSVRDAQRHAHDQLFSLLIDVWRAFIQVKHDTQSKLAETLEDSLNILAVEDLRILQDNVISAVRQHGDTSSPCQIGGYMSEVATITLSLADLMTAEKYLLEGEQRLTSQEQLKCAKARLHSIVRHADLLAAQTDIDVSAAESRYRGAVLTAKKYAFEEEIAKFQAKYAFFLTDQGRYDEALPIAKQSLNIDSREPVARLAIVRAQQQNGQLDAPAKIRAAKDTLASLSDNFSPSSVEEGLRSELFSSFDSWGKVAEVQDQHWSAGGIVAIGRQCMQYTDVAHFLLCFICGGTLPG